MSKETFISLFPNRERKSEKSPLIFGLLSETTKKGRKEEKTEWSVSMWGVKNEPRKFSGVFSLRGERETEGRITLNFLKSQKTEKSPVGRGEIEFNDGEKMEFAIWAKVSEKGEKYFSGVASEYDGNVKTLSDEEQAQSLKVLDDVLDDLPF